jgi:hypothetical protein
MGKGEPVLCTQEYRPGQPGVCTPRLFLEGEGIGGLLPTQSGSRALA